MGQPFGITALAADEAPLAPPFEELTFDDGGLIDVVYLVTLEPFEGDART